MLTEIIHFGVDYLFNIYFTETDTSESRRLAEITVQFNHHVKLKNLFSLSSDIENTVNYTMLLMIEL